MFFCESRKFLQDNDLCIISWSSPVIAIRVNIPPKNCLKKYCGWFGSSKWNILDIPLSLTAGMMSPMPNPSALLIKTVHRTIESSMQAVFRKSIQITAFTPPRNVYRRSTSMVINTLTQNGIPRGPNTISCREMHTRYSLTDAPNILEMKKNQAPVR